VRVCYWGTYDRDYPRNRILQEGLRASGAEVRECHAPLWRDSADKLTRARGSWLRPDRVLRAAWTYGSLAVRFLSGPRPDFVFVGYAGHFDVFPAWCLCRLRGVPLVFDAFLSLYDSLVLDRGVVASGGAKARFLAWVDRTSCRLAGRVLLDTRTHAEFFSESFGLSREKVWVLPIGADDRVFHPLPPAASNGHPYTVLHYGRYIPLHGLETVVGAAQLLEESGEACRFVLVGDGDERGKIETLARQRGVRSIEFRGAEAPDRLAGTIRESDLCLGIFGVTGKAARVIPNKVYEAMAAGKPVITGDSPAARELLRDGEDCLLCERGDPRALAAAIRRLRSDRDLSRRLAEGGRRRFEEKAAPAVIGRNLRERLESWRGSHERAA